MVNFMLPRFRLFCKLCASGKEFKKRRRLSEEVEHLWPFKKRGIVLENQVEAQRMELEAWKKQADKYYRRLKKECRLSHFTAMENKKLKAKIKNLLVGLPKQWARTVHCREKMKAWGARQRAKAKVSFSFRKGGRITTKRRQLQYDLYRHRVAGNQHTNVVYDVPRFLGLTSRLGKVCSCTAIKKMRTEYGLFNIKCPAGSMKDSTVVDPSFSFGQSRDGTERRRILYLVDAAHFQAPNGGLAHWWTPTLNIKATTQVKANARSFHNLKQLSQGVVEPSYCKACITDGASNKKPTNNIEGLPGTNCLQHNGSNATIHGASLIITKGWTDCPCQQKKTPPHPPQIIPQHGVNAWCAKRGFMKSVLLSS